MKEQLTQKFRDARKIIEKVVQARADHRKAVQDITDKHDYTVEYQDREKAKLDETLRLTQQEAYHQLSEVLNETQVLLRGDDAPLNLDSVELQNALALITTLGAEMDVPTARKIVAQFVGDQPSLRVLKSVLKNQGAGYLSLFDGVIYSPDSAVSSLQNFVYSSLVDNTVSLNELSREFGRLAGFEGVAWENGIVDEHAYDMNIRRAAGLEPNYS